MVRIFALIAQEGRRIILIVDEDIKSAIVVDVAEGYSASGAP